MTPKCPACPSRRPEVCPGCRRILPALLLAFLLPACGGMVEAPGAPQDGLQDAAPGDAGADASDTPGDACRWVLESTGSQAAADYNWRNTCEAETQ